MNESSLLALRATNGPQKPDAATTGNIIKSTFSRLMSAANDRTERFATEIVNAPQTGPCPKCTVPGQSLDSDATLDESVRHNRLRPVYVVCDHCAAEAHRQERMARFGVPTRVRHATLENFEFHGEVDDRRKQAEAITAIQKFIADPKKIFLCLLGSSGAGKGHLAAGAVRECVPVGASESNAARWYSHPSLIDEAYTHSLETRPGFIGRLARTPVLVLDEMGTKNMTSDTVEIFYKLLDRRYEEGWTQQRKTILIGNIPLRTTDEKKIALLPIIGGSRIESRFVPTATVIYPRWDDYRKKMK